MNSYELSRKWFDWCFENPEKVSPNHSALYFFAIEHCNRLGWREKFGFPTEMAKDAIGIKSYTTYIKTLNDLVDFGFIVMIEKSKNQYSSNIIALTNFDKALDKALDKAISTHLVKQVESNVSINKLLNIKTIKLLNIYYEKVNLNLEKWIFQEEEKKEPKKEIYRKFDHLELSVEDFEKLNSEYEKSLIDEVLDKIENYKNNKTYKSLYLTAKNWLKKEKSSAKKENEAPSQKYGRMTEEGAREIFLTAANVKIPGT